jgi:hypothetical protein
MPAFSWRAAALLQYPRANPVALVLEDGRVLVAHGHVKVYDPRYELRNVAAVEVWDPERNRWSLANNLVDSQGKLVGVRGQRWDAITRRWRRVTQLTEPGSPGTISLPDGARLTVGGAEWKGGKPFGKRETELSRVQLRPLRGRPRPASLKQGRINAVLTLLRDGRVLVTGGYETSIDYSWETNRRSVGPAEILCPKDGSVREGGVLVRARHDHTAVLLPDGSVMLIGGRKDEGGELAHAELGQPV